MNFSFGEIMISSNFLYPILILPNEGTGDEVILFLIVFLFR